MRKSQKRIQKTSIYRYRYPPLIFVAYFLYLLHIRNIISVVLLNLMFNSAHFAKMIAKLLQ